MENNLDKIRESQKWILNLYKKIKKVLDENQIEYFAIGGTAIGALREKGFIPWDDDLDIGIHESQIDRAREVLKNAGFLMIDKHEKTNVYIYDKVYDPNVLTKDPEKEEGYLWIDIFTLFDHRKYSTVRLSWKNAVEYVLYIKHGRARTMYKIWKWYMWLPFSILRYLPITKAKLQKMAVKSMRNRRYVDEDGKAYIYHQSRLSRFLGMDISKSIETKFEDTTIPVAHNYAEDVKDYFGDVYKEPEPKDRYNHGFDIIENKYNEK